MIKLGTRPLRVNNIKTGLYFQIDVYFYTGSYLKIGLYLRNVLYFLTGLRFEISLNLKLVYKWTSS